MSDVNYRKGIKKFPFDNISLKEFLEHLQAREKFINVLINNGFKLKSNIDKLHTKYGSSWTKGRILKLMNDMFTYSYQNSSTVVMLAVDIKDREGKNLIIHIAMNVYTNSGLKI